ncbi:SMC domain protein [Clostridium sp. DL-VIII]|uniref:SbcC/MukB-like Walker B domain-containing protein n=1 Tax=Clostridium sp. DL-VIII TaxID=641107 RepID=UPI00023AF1C5|nr:AAA family ATPase [Clostridium sp. DL-VIII]EHI98211.1 SMC domain protein [Clostridium sp. DL-VIII]
MRPIKLRIKGLNSFIDEQTIDFDRLTDRGFFGIFGPTGSGKSTILDGITLALYGNVARKSSNYINTNCDKLNVNFEFQISGAEIKRYVIDREFKRKKDGGINSGKCKIVDITNIEEEEVLADGVKTINKKVEEIIGLNLEDFSRTVVLPQGKFSEFLKLEGKDRRDMLERLFNLEQFGDNLSRKLSLKINKERTENSVLLGQLSGYDDISEDILKEKKNILEELKKDLEILKEELKVIEKNYKENEEIWKLQLDLEEYKNKEKVLKEQEEKINKYIEIIKLGEAGAKVIPYINAFENTIKEFKINEIELDRLKATIEKIKEEKESIEKLWNEAKVNKDKKLPQLMIQEQKVKDAIEEKKLVDEIQKKIDILKLQISEAEVVSKRDKEELIKVDEEIKDKNKIVKEHDKKYEKLKIDEQLKEKVQEGILLEEKLNSLKSSITKDNDKKNFLEKENDKTISDGKSLRNIIEKSVKALEEKEKHYEELLKNSPGESKDLVNLKQLMIENEQKWKSHNKLIKEIEFAEEEIKKLNTEVITKKEDEQRHEEELEKIKLKQKEMERENLANILRSGLKEGEVCPVCGSTHHNKEDIVKIEVKNIDDIEKEVQLKEAEIKTINNSIIEKQTRINNFNEKIKINEEEINKLGIKFKEKSLEELQDEFKNLEKALEDYTKDKETLDKDINKLKNDINIKNGEINELRAVVRTNKRQLDDLEKNLKENTEQLNDIESKINTLRAETSVIDFIEKSKEIREIEKEREKIAKIIKSNRELLEVLDKNREKLNNELTMTKEKLTKDNAELKSHEENKEEKLHMIKSKVNNEEDLPLLLSTVKNNIQNINKEFEKAESSKNAIEKEFLDNNEKFIATVSKNKELSKRKNEEESRLEVAIDSEGFNSLDDVKKNLIKKEEINEYKLKVDNYKDSALKVKGAIESLLNKISGKELSEEEYSKVKLLQNQKEVEVNEANEHKIKLEEELKSIKTKLDEQKELLEKKSKLEHKLALLNDLDKLFKGKKFVEFVAINRLKYISIEASRRLKEITHGNYGLEVDENSRFIIRDYKNGGARRDATTLSGGETFLASLSLALALSAQIQLKGTAPLELFFLDEGFGTLDDELLEVVMSSLERIHNEKLKVGIISHVEAIKNRVPVKLMITPAECGMGGSKVRIERS